MMAKSTRQSSHAAASRPQPSSSRSNPSVTNPRRFEESWVEVASQPSSSSLSSIGDEIVTTGLRVRGSQHGRRRLQGSSARSLLSQQTAVPAAGASSQDEYDESESDEHDDDKLLASSPERGNTSPEVVEPVSETESESDGDDVTALGHTTSHRPLFRPQPNAFSHPPANASQRSHPTTSNMAPHPHSGFTRPAFPQTSQARFHRRGPSFMTPSVREDNDAALRASLTTLLSCAAAARGLPKAKDETEAWRAARNGVGPSEQPMELLFIPESELMQEEPVRTARQKRPCTSPARSPTRTSTRADKPRRSMSEGSSPRPTKKKKVVATSSEDYMISPTLLTWVVSAGVVVLVSVVGFGAGYVIGREVGRQEATDVFAASISAANETSHTGREVIRTSSGLRKLRWGAGAVSRSMVAQA
ncbi:hypothetical protein E4U24_006394 [Claviceps purpurea]|nr:hypothetical protein E4U37_006323 [Claviceps purpurea]KAG6177919.1 hypothetical protein E4U10_008370 [Claviceps purpurea]KAG6178091.1 hypothetical protein E4U27_003960 [Claviceps purpurea]KAG6204588.1 hypothetical protein E4U50_005161 [Claviceps purpurea]KAG6222285.1 hypothetical protein E4U26_005392 [Claviceps purpurea]